MNRLESDSNFKTFSYKVGDVWALNELNITGIGLRPDKNLVLRTRSEP